MNHQHLSSYLDNHAAGYAAYKDVFFAMNGIYLLTDSLSLLEQVIDTGIHAVQLRNKKKVDFTTAKEMKRMCTKFQIPLIVNDRVDLALAIKADGVHLGQEDLPIKKARLLLGPKKIIGISVATLAAIKKAISEKATYVSVGHIFKTTTKKKEGPPLGISFLQSITDQASIPLFAIGGIQLTHVEAMKKASVNGIAIHSAITEASSPRAAAKQFVQLWNGINNKSNSKALV